jgi:hypothetical protein
MACRTLWGVFEAPLDGIRPPEQFRVLLAVTGCESQCRHELDNLLELLGGGRTVGRDILGAVDPAGSSAT